MKRTLALLIAVLMVVAILPLSALAAAEQTPEVSVSAKSQTSSAPATEVAYEATDVRIGYLSGASAAAVPAAGAVPFAAAEVVPPFTNEENAVELLQGATSVGFYNSIADALADVTDGSTLKLHYDHIEQDAIQTADVSWTLDGNGKTLYAPGGIVIGGDAGTVEIKDLMLVTDADGIHLNPTNADANVVVKVNNVIVIAGMNTDAAFAAFRVANMGGELTVSGENSGAIVEAAGASVFYNAGYLQIDDGLFLASATVVIETVGEGNTVVMGGWFESDGACVARTASTTGKAVLGVMGGTMILNPAMIEVQEDSYGVAVITNGTDAAYGDVYIYGGQFINNNDGTVLGRENTYSRQVLAQSSAKGDFQIFGGIMIATAVQDFFFALADGEGDGFAIPTANLPIVKGATAKYEFDGRDCYYMVYGLGDSLVVPEMKTSFDANVNPAAGTTPASVDLVFTATLDAIHYSTLLTWARVKAYDYNKTLDSDSTVMDNYELAYGMLITLPEALRMTGGVLDQEAFEDVGALYMDYDADVALNADGSFDISVALEDILAEENTMAFIAIPYIELTLDVDGAQEITTRYYGEYNTNSGAVSMADVAARLLRDNLDTQAGAYQYPSITVEGAFNRYTVEEQEILQTYLPHAHDFDYKGECQTDGCDESVAVELLDGDVAPIFVESNTVHFFELTLKEGATYILEFTKDIVSYTLYDADGAVCAAPKGVYTAAEDGTYYLRVQGKQSGSAYVMLSHIHDANYLGECDVCEDTLSYEIWVDEENYDYFTKNNFNFYNVELDEGISYTLNVVNGIARLFDAEGNEQVFENGKYACAATGTYYIVVEGIYSGEGSIRVSHIHDYDYTGVCVAEGCEDCVLTILNNVYAYMPPKAVSAGMSLYYAINLTAGNTYGVKTNRYFGTFQLFDAEGNEILLINDSFTCEEDGMYYLVISVDVYVNNAQVSFNVDHACGCDYKGLCQFEHVNADGEVVTVSCGEVYLERLYDGEMQDMMIEPGRSYSFQFNFAGKNTVYVIDLPKEGVTYKLYDDKGNLLETVAIDSVKDATRIADEYANGRSDKILYLVVTCTADEEMALQFTLSHKHEVDYTTGACGVTNTTRNQPCDYNRGQVLEVGVEKAETFVIGESWYYQVQLERRTTYKITITGCPGATWVIMDDRGREEYSSTQGDTISGAKNATYYLIVTPAQNGDPDATIKIEVVS